MSTLTGDGVDADGGAIRAVCGVLPVVDAVEGVAVELPGAGADEADAGGAVLVLDCAPASTG
jgi:hypothetical protein